MISSGAIISGSSPAFISQTTLPYGVRNSAVAQFNPSNDGDKAISNPKFPLIESAGKNLLKLYLNDVGLLTNLLYRNNINAILGDERSVNLGSVYESVVAQELRTHDNNLFYYDNKVRGEVDFLIDDYDLLSVVPIEVKSGKDYTVHSALNLFVSNDEYSIKQGIVLSNERDVFADGKIIYMPIYYVMFLQQKKVDFIKI